MLLDELIKKYSFTLPEEGLAGVYLKINDFDVYENLYLEWPVDLMFSEIIREIGKHIANDFESCISVYTHNDTILLTFKIDEDNDNLQYLVSTVASKATVLLYSTLLNLILNYNERVETIDFGEDANAEEKKEILSNRIENLTKLLESNLTYFGNAFYIPESKKEDLYLGLATAAEIETKNRFIDAYGDEQGEDQFNHLRWELADGTLFEKNIVGTLIEKYLMENPEENEREWYAYPETGGDTNE